MPSGAETTPRPLQGVRVVAFEQYISGPYCTSILAHLGAEVLKIENPRTGGDPRRSYAPSRHGVSSGFAGYNRGKRSVALDFGDERDADELRELIGTADVVVSNLRPGALERRGFGASRLRADDARLIVCEVTGFGVTGGPYGAWPAFDSVIQAMSGLSSLLQPEPDGRPSLAPMSTMDIQAGTWAALGILAALQRRELTGEGSHIDAAMYDIAVASLERPLTLAEFGVRGNRAGSDQQSAVGAFRALGGWVAIVIPTDEMWARCCRAIGREDLLADPDLASIAARAARMRDVIVPALEDWAARERLDAHDCAARLSAAGQPAGPVQTIEEVRHSPQLTHREFFEPLQGTGDEAHREPVALPRFPLLFDGQAFASGPVPELGEFNRAREGGGGG